MNEIWPYISFGLSVVVVVLGGLLGVIYSLGYGWVNHVDEGIKALWQKFDDEQRAREQRWHLLFQQCNRHGEKLSRIEGKLNARGGS